MSSRLHHLNLLVPDLDRAIDYWHAVTGAPPIVEDLPDRGVRTARFDLSGTWLVLLEPTETTGVPAQHLARHGAGLFLLSLGVDDLDAARCDLNARGVSTLGAARRGLAQCEVQDVEADPSTGVQVQVCRDSG